MDVILCPVHPMPAPPLHTSRYWGYTSLWNLLDYPAIAFPVGKVDPGKDAENSVSSARNDLDRWYIENHNVDKQKEAPVSLQLVAKRLEDEKLLQAFKEIKEKIGLPFIDCLV